MMMWFDRNHWITRCIGDKIKAYMPPFKECKVMICLSLQEN